MQGWELAKRIGEKSGAIVLPILPFGYSEYHMDFPGTLWIQKETLFSVLMDVVRSLNKWGIKRILFVNGHGGNYSVLQSIAVRVRREFGILVAIAHWWDVMPEVAGHPSEQHAGIAEVSMCLGINRDIVNLDEAYLPVPKNLSEKLVTVGIDQVMFGEAKIRVFLRTSDVTDAGSMTEQLGVEEVKDFSQATPELGEEMLDKISTTLADFIKEFEKIELAQPPQE
jgi:creatinine amidohydrolase